MSCDFRLHAGDLRHQVELQSSTTSQSASGQPTKSWSTYATVRAKIYPRKSDERSTGGQTTALTTHDVTIRYRSDVKHKHRVKMVQGTRYLYIKAIRNLEELNQALVLECSEDVE